MSLALGDWVGAGHSVLITGPTGTGKSWLACALAQYACRRGQSALYLRVPRLEEELRIRHGNGTFGKWLLQLAKCAYDPKMPHVSLAKLLAKKAAKAP